MLVAWVRAFAAGSCLILLAACNRDPRIASRKYADSGNKYFELAKYKEASILYRRALAKDRRFGDAWYRLGLTNLKLRVPGEARRDFSRAMEIDPGNTDAIVRLGELDLSFYLLDPQVNRALLADLKDLVRRLFKKDPKSFDGLRFSGYIALMEKDRKTAIEKFTAANREKPGQPELVAALVQALMDDDQGELAEQFAQDLIEKQKSYGPIYDTLYLYYLQNNQVRLGEELLRTKIANNPAQGNYVVQLAFHYHLANRSSDMTATLERLTSDPKTYPDNRMLVGDFYERIGDFDSALKQYDRGRQDTSRNTRAFQKRVVEILATQGKRDAAAGLIASLLREDPKDPEVLALHAALTLESAPAGQIKNLIGELQLLTIKMPGNPVLHLNLGRAYMRSPDPQGRDQARTQFVEALTIEPRYEPAKLALCELELTRGRNAQAVQIAGEVLAVDPGNLEARLMRATGLTRIKENQRARTDLILALKMHPKSRDARFQLGEVDLDDRNYSSAETGFRYLMEASDPRGFTGLLRVKAAQGQWDAAVKLAEDRLRSFPDSSEYRAQLATTLFKAGRYRDATNQFQELIDKQPNSADLYVRVGESKRFSGDIEGAIQAFRKATSLEPRNVLANLNLAMSYEQIGRDPEARRSYQDVINVEPDNVEALNNLAYLEAANGVDLDQALVHAQRAQQRRPDDPNVKDTIALIYIRKNVLDESLRLLRELVIEKPDNPSFHLHLAMALYQKGDRPLAKRELQLALRNKPNPRDQGEIRQLLAKVG